MTHPPASPRATRLAAPSWLDARLVAGVLVVLVCVVVGARVLSSADASSSVWLASRDLAPGSTLGEDDVHAGRVRLFDDASRYLAAGGAKPVGWVLARGVGADELLPRDSLVRPDDPARALRHVSVPVAPGHLPDDLRSGQQVDVYVTGAAGSGRAEAAAAAGAEAGTSGGGTAGGGVAGGGTAGGGNGAAPAGGASGGAAGDGSAASGAVAAGSPTRLVLAGATVALRPRAAGLGGSSTQGVVLAVPEADAPGLVAAVQAGDVDLVRVPRAAELPAPALAAAAPGGS